MLGPMYIFSLLVSVFLLSVIVVVRVGIIFVCFSSFEFVVVCPRMSPRECDVT